VLDGFGAVPIYSSVHEILVRAMCNLIGRYDGVAQARVRRIESGEERRVELPVPYPMPHAPTRWGWSVSSVGCSSTSLQQLGDDKRDSTVVLIEQLVVPVNIAEPHGVQSLELFRPLGRLLSSRWCRRRH